MTTRRVFASTVLGLIIVLSGCGGGAATEIDATLKDFAFSPTSWEIPAGETITISMTNEGAVEHEWVLLKPGVTISSEADLPDTEEVLLADFVYWEEEVEPGASKSETFTAPAAGEYQIICAIPSHFDAGMEGTLTVVDEG
ncbi:MAG: cupredoxin domain-containing protein [Acidimicrobiia bacterium]|nr:cupredoxin domain-containing protein [Acidimicrobiia bacterium]